MSATKGATTKPENETELFTRYFEEWKGVGKDKEESFQKIPRFYFKVIGLVMSPWHSSLFNSAIKNYKLAMPQC